MPNYRVHFHAGASLSVVVAAENEEAAEDAAYEAIGAQYLCTHCSGWGKNYSLDLGEWERDDDEYAITEVEN